MEELLEERCMDITKIVQINFMINRPITRIMGRIAYYYRTSRKLDEGIT